MKSNAEHQSPGGMLSPTSDSDIRRQLVAIAGGDRRSFEALYLQMYPALSRFVSRHCTRRELIEEIINEAFWVVWRKAGSFRGDSKASTWIIGIAYRCMLKMLRDQPEFVNNAINTEIQDSSVGDENQDSEQRELRDWLARGMALLPADQRTTLQLAYYLGQSCEEIAEVMGCAVGTVKARLFHARVRLRNSLPKLGGIVDTSNLPGNASS